MAETTETVYLSVADTAKLLRKALKAEFPGVKFSVRSNSYAGGASIDVSWTDGPLASTVEVVAKRYEGASFDGMIDLKSYHSTLVAFDGGLPTEVHMGADYVFTRRDVGSELTAKASEWAKANQCSNGPGTVYWTENPDVSGVVALPGALSSGQMWNLEQAASMVARLMTEDGVVHDRYGVAL